MKDEPCSVGGLGNFKITKNLLQSDEGSYYIRYQACLEAKKIVKVDQERKKKEKEQK